MQSLAGLRTVANEYNAVLIGETWTNDIAELKQYYGKNHEVLQMPMDLMMLNLKPLSADVFRKHVAAVDRFGRVAGLGDEQPRQSARLQPLCRWEARR